MGVSNGQVTLNDEPTKTKLYRFCEKKIDQWIQTQLGSEGPIELPEDAEFSVTFTEETGTRQVSCTTEIHLGGATYRGWDLASDTQQAFIHSLKRLQPH